MLHNIGHSFEIRGRYNRQLQPWTRKVLDNAPSWSWRNTTYHTPTHFPEDEGLLKRPTTAYPTMNRYLGPTRCLSAKPDLSVESKMPVKYARFTPAEWSQCNLGQFNESDVTRNSSERLRSEAVRCMRQTEEITHDNQRESNRRLAERLTESQFWHNEIRGELERMVDEKSALSGAQHALQKALRDLEEPLHISKECLYQREQRQEIDLVHDDVEKCLLTEVETIKDSMKMLNETLDRANDQQRTNRAAQHDLETDVRSKEGAIDLDGRCFMLNNYSGGINYYNDVENYDTTVSDMRIWTEHTNRIINRSMEERRKSQQLRADIDNTITQLAQRVWNAWCNTNNAFTRRVSETVEARNKLDNHYQKLQQEIFSAERNIELLRKAIHDKNNPLKVAQTRLEIRNHRLGIENSKDPALERLVHEVYDLSATLDTLHKRLQEVERQHQHLLKTRNEIEQNIQFKINSIFIDREKCLAMRRAYPITTTIKY